jgi:hypothetical protein
MGILLSTCCLRNRGNETWDELHSTNIVLRTQLKQISIRYREMHNAYDELRDENKKLTNMVKHTKNILKNSDSVADTILLSELNCKWMDDDNERVYLISIVDFLNDVCSDITCILYSDNDNHDNTVSYTNQLLKK